MDVGRLLRSSAYRAARKNGSEMQWTFLQNYYRKAVDSSDTLAQYELVFEMIDFCRAHRDTEGAIGFAKSLSSLDPPNAFYSLLVAQWLVQIGENRIARILIKQVQELLPGVGGVVLDHAQLVQLKNLEIQTHSPRSKATARSCQQLAALIRAPIVRDITTVDSLLAIEGDAELMEAKSSILKRVWAELILRERFQNLNCRESIVRIETEIDRIAAEIDPNA